MSDKNKPKKKNDSGTEPKIKVYSLTQGKDATERDANIEKYGQWAEALAK